MTSSVCTGSLEINIWILIDKSEKPGISVTRRHDWLNERQHCLVLNKKVQSCVGVTVRVSEG